MNNNFSHLHNHTTYSVLDGVGSPEAFAKKAKDLGHKYLAITDHGNIDGTIHFQEACKKEGVIPIIGCEFYICEDLSVKNKSNKNRHINLFVKNEIGWHNVLKMLTIANLHGYYYKPRIDAHTLLKHIDGLVIATACNNSFMADQWGLDLFKKLAVNNPEDLYFEIMPHDFEDQRKWNKKCIKLSKEYDIDIIATNDCHYPNKEDNILQEICLAIQTRDIWRNKNRFKFSIDTLYLCSDLQMKKWFRRFHPYISRQQTRQYLDNTLQIAEKCCDFKISKAPVYLPLIPQCKDKNEEKKFRAYIRKGLKSKIREGFILENEIEIYRDRITEEFELIKSKGFIRYFLIVWELINWCKQNNILTGPARGSSAGSLICYLIGITNVDSIKYDLLFSRFIDLERNDLPDIDIDFEANKRDRVIKHIKQLYGENNVTQISTFLKMKGKMALQDVSRVFEINKTEINSITKKIEDKEELSIKTFTESNDNQLIDFYKKHSDIVDYAIRIQGNLRAYGRHAAGICISDKNLTDGSKCNFVKRNNDIIANWEKDNCEYVGLMKLDILGLNALCRISECLKLIKKTHNDDISQNLNELTFDDPEIFKDINDGFTEGIFQLGTYGITKFCMQMGVDTFKDIYNATALYRPGPLGSGMAKEFLNRKKNKKWKLIHPIIENITKETYGIIIYQEQIMFLFRDIAGFDWGKCNLVRKVIAKSKGTNAINKFRDEFMQGCFNEGTLSGKQAIELFDQIVSFAKYSFNKSHSVAYSMISYYDAWLKHYYDVEFYCSCLSFLDEEKRKEILSIAVEEDIKIILPKIGLSEAVKWTCNEDSLIMPFNELIGVGEKQAQTIIKETNKKRKGFFTSSSNNNLPPKIKAVLNSCKAYNKEYKFTYNELNKVEKYFKYDLHSLFF